MISHKQWLENEYRQWMDALHECTPYNFKDHPMVKRMLGDFVWPEEFQVPLDVSTRILLTTIDNIGRSVPLADISGPCWRMIYYAKQVLERKPPSIVEIGGGVGQFYAVMRALGYKGDYYISDIPDVMLFQNAYLRAINYETKLNTSQKLRFDFCVSFYALGEFDDETKDWYIELVVKKCSHGFVIWNPHSGASPAVNFPCSIRDEYPLLSPGNKQLEW